MSVLSDLLGLLEEKLFQLLSPVIGPVRGLINLITQFTSTAGTIFERAGTLITDVAAEYDKIKNFKSDPHWKNRVISVPKAVETIQDLVTTVPETFITAVKDLVQQLKSKLNVATPELEDIEGIEDLRALGTKLGTRFSAIFEKVLGFAALILDALNTISSTIDDLQTIVDDIGAIVDDLDNLDGFFLQQNNKRKVVDGPHKIRVGKLHS